MTPAMMTNGSAVGLGARRTFAGIAPIVGRDFAEVQRILWPEPLATELVALLRHCLDSGEPYVSTLDEERRRDSGAVESYDWRVERVTLPEGGWGIVVFFYDLSERLTLEAALRQSEQRLRLATEAAGIGVFDLDVQAGVSVWTPAMEAMHGMAPGEFGGTFQDWERLVHPADRDAAVARVEHALATGELVEYEWRVVWSDGSVRWLTGRFQAFRDATGQPVRLTGVNIDVTERRRVEDALRASLAEKDVLLQEVHHRVKNNLQMISSLLQLQRREQQEVALQTVLAEAENRVHAMALVHEQLYQRNLLSEVDFGRYLHCLVQQLLRSGTAQLSLELKLQPLLLPVNTAIPLALIATELITNALKYAWRDRDASVLRIVLHGAGPKHLAMEVADNGPGLPDDLEPQAATKLPDIRARKAPALLRHSYAARSRPPSIRMRATSFNESKALDERCGSGGMNGAPEPVSIQWRFGQPQFMNSISPNMASRSTSGNVVPRRTPLNVVALE